MKQLIETRRLDKVDLLIGDKNGNNKNPINMCFLLYYWRFSNFSLLIGVRIKLPLSSILREIESPFPIS